MLLSEDNLRLKEVINTFCQGKELLFSKHIGISQPRINRLFNIDARNKRYPELSYEIVKATLVSFPQLSADWLILGKGEMLRTDEDALQRNAAELEEEYISNVKKEIPLYRLSNFLSLSELLYGDSPGSTDEPITIPFAPFSDGAILLSGSLAKSGFKGDIALYQKVEPLFENIIYGEMYIISLQVGNDEYTSLGYILASEEENCIRLSDTPTGESSQTFPFSRIRAMALIKATVYFHQLR